MDAEPTTHTRIVNVKGMRADSWDRAKATADRNGETLGEFVSRAIDRLAEAEAGGRQLAVLPPAEAALPAPIAPPAISPLEALSFLLEAGLPIQKRIGRRLNRLIYDGLTS